MTTARTTASCSPQSVAAATNALAESFIDSVKTELIADRVANSRRITSAGSTTPALHESLGDRAATLRQIPPIEYEREHADREATRLGGATV